MLKIIWLYVFQNVKLINILQLMNIIAMNNTDVKIIVMNLQLKKQDIIIYVMKVAKKELIFLNMVFVN